jgi:mannose-6-phosphate isomerase-like protein (cupin superfamily)
VSSRSREGFAIALPGQLEQAGNWRLVRRSLACQSFGINVVEIPAGGSIPEHDELARDQEEIFSVLAGDAVLVVDGEEHPFPAGAFARIDPEHSRTVRNPAGEAATVLIISAPRTSGYEPMEWA